MIHHRTTAKFLFLIFSLLILTGSFKLNAQDAAAGKALFQANCTSCHSVRVRVTGPALAGVEERVTDKKKLHAWIKNNQSVLKSGDPYFTGLFNEYNKTPMNLFPTLTDPEIDNILAYIKKEESTPATTSTPTTEAGKESDNTLIYGIITLIMAVIALILLQVNSNLRKLSDDKEGIPTTEPIPFYRNKTYITLFTLLIFVVAGYYTIQAAIGLGRTKNYQPVQPIYYSHRVHVGINQINCLYCHGGAFEGKHANVPSVNICMNCHQAIQSYTKGPQLYDEDGKEVNANAEIEKLYKYAGFTPGQPWDPGRAKPVEWIRIHNLPDHVYFNHSQHTRAGKIQCQTCHGPINEMDEVKQFAELGMGWCINCHRTTRVDFPDSTGKGGNRFYSIYQKFQNDLKEHRVDSITVEKVGGTECQRCHY